MPIYLESVCTAPLDLQQLLTYRLQYVKFNVEDEHGSSDQNAPLLLIIAI